MILKNYLKKTLRKRVADGVTFIRSVNVFNIDKLPFDIGLDTNLEQNLARFEVFLKSY